MADTKIKKITYQKISQQIEQIIDTFSEAIYFKHYHSQRYLNPSPSQAPNISQDENSPLTTKNPLPKDGHIVIFNRAFAQELIYRILRKDPLIAHLGLQKVLEQLGIVLKNGNIRLTNEKLDKFRRKIRSLTDFDIFYENYAKKFRKDDFEVMYKKKIIWDQLERRDAFPNNRPSTISTTKVPWFNEEGKILGVMALCRDISGCSKFLYQLCDQFPGCAFVVVHGRWEYINPKGAEILGFKNPGDLLKKEFAHILNNPSEYNSMEYCFKNDKWIKNQQLYLRHHHSTVLRVRMTASQLLNEKGEFVGFQGVMIDETLDFEEEMRKKAFKSRISDLKDRTLKELQEIFDKYLEDKTLIIKDEVSSLPYIAQEIYYWIVRNNMSNDQIAARLRKLDRSLTHSQALKKAQNYVQIIRKKLYIHGKGRQGIIQHAQMVRMFEEGQMRRKHPRN
jgi:hypothetical protein